MRCPTCTYDDFPGGVCPTCGGNGVVPDSSCPEHPWAVTILAVLVGLLLAWRCS